jgi:hypothetical protein
MQAASAPYSFAPVCAIPVIARHELFWCGGFRCGRRGGPRKVVVEGGAGKTSVPRRGWGMEVYREITGLIRIGVGRLRIKHA